MLEYLWYLLGYVKEEEQTMMCINSFGPTKKQLNYVMRRIYFDEDEYYDSEAEAEDYINRFYR
jgi:hypothetical protein